MLSETDLIILTIFTFLFFLGAIILLIFILFTKIRYTKAKIMTPGELRFYKVLKYAVAERYYILAQVRLANVVKIPGKFFLWKNFNPLGAKCVDFVLVDKATGDTLLVIELDDKSHLLPDRIKRDKFVNKVLSEAKIPILHLKYQSHYDSAKLLETIQKALQ